MSTEKKLRLILFKDCNRACPGCCNNTIDFEALPVCTDYRDYDEIMLTGGEPMLHPGIVMQAVREIREQTKAPIYLYTANTTRSGDLRQIIRHITGVTITCHTPADVFRFGEFAEECFTHWLDTNRSMRVKILKGLKYIFRAKYIENWEIREFEMLEDCPLPEGEILMRYAPQKEKIMSEEKKGLYQKYKVLKADGSEPKGTHCYFVLDIISDDPAQREACREALKTYAVLIAPTNPKLALDLRDLLLGGAQ